MTLKEFFTNLDQYHFGFTTQLIVVISACIILLFGIKNKKERVPILVLALILMLFLIFDIITEYIK